MKPIEQHLQELPEPYRSEALENIKEGKKDTEVNHPARAIRFVNWSNTRINRHYWVMLCYQLEGDDPQFL